MSVIVDDVGKKWVDNLQVSSPELVEVQKYLIQQLSSMRSENQCKNEFERLINEETEMKVKDIEKLKNDRIGQQKPQFVQKTLSGN